MSADDLLQIITQVLYVVIFVVVGLQALRRPLRANIDIALFFGVTALIIAIGWVSRALNVESEQQPRLLMVVTSSMLMALPYLLLRLVDDFADVPRWLLHAAEAGLALAVVGLALISPLPAGLALLYVLYFVALQVYAVAAIVREARRSNGLTRRRLQAVAAGSLCLGLVIFFAGVALAAPGDFIWTEISQILAMISALAYFIGVAPPAFLRHAWQEPELRAFLGRAATLPRLPDTPAIVRALEEGAADSVGAPHATIALWDDEAGVLYSSMHDVGLFTFAAGQFIAGRSFATQQSILSTNAQRDDPANADTYRAYGAMAVLAAPITAGDKRLGVLGVYAPRAPIFAEDDLVLVQLLADQAAVILESRALIDEAARVRAREEATRLKDDFLSSAAHDLKTPLTTLMAQAQLLERRATRSPEAPPDVSGIQRIVRESKRLNTLVLELLDASRLEQGRLLGEREPVELVALAREACERVSSPRHSCIVRADGAVIGDVDRLRVMQLLDNLIDNAVKYSPDGGTVEVKVWTEDRTAHVSVTDQGIGIPADDLPHIFDRFHRGRNVDDRRYAGMGLGLFICRGIAEQHGGRIEVMSTPGKGSTVHVVLPAPADDSR